MDQLLLSMCLSLKPQQVFTFWLLLGLLMLIGESEIFRRQGREAVASLYAKLSLA